MNQAKTGTCVFKEKITYPEVEKSVDKNTFVTGGQILESHSKRHINQNVTDSTAIPEKGSIVTIIPGMIVNVDLWLVNKPANYMPVIMMVIIIFVMPV